MWIWEKSVVKLLGVLPSLKQEILAWAGVSEKKQQSMVDAFAQKYNAQFP